MTRQTNRQKAISASIAAQLPYLNANYLERISIHIETYLARQEEVEQPKNNVTKLPVKCEGGFAL